MKNFLRFACIMICLFSQTQLFANTLIVKGTVTDSSNNPVANRTVKIYSTDSTNHGCLISHTKATNLNGFYIDTLTCDGDIRKLSIIVENCNGDKITKEIVVTPNTTIETNFVICRPTTVPGVLVPCKAAYSYTSLPTGVKFNSAGSSGTYAADSIVSRTWTFGDSSATLTGNIVDPTHAYTKPGIYNVCLTIKTRNGCENKYCSTVVFTPASNDCNVQAVFSTEMIGSKTFRFNSSQSSTLSGDSIVQRIWKFGDGFSLDGNQINPSRQFKDTGLFNVCLSVRTAKGCEKQYCFNLVVRDSSNTRTNCKATYMFMTSGTTAKFNAAGSVAPTGDSIISRIWIFGDSTAALTGNRLDPSHTYTKAGTYNVCLYIKSKGGCENSFCQNITVRDTTSVPTNCKAIFTYTIKDSVITFNSADSKGTSSTDSIISRTWYYTDSTTSVSLPGNVIAPSYPYTKPGKYTVYLVIKTKSGCESKYAGVVVIEPKQTPTNCKAVFTYAIKDSVITFNSADSRGTTPADSIISRIWSYSDSTTSVSLPGNVIAPSYPYTKTGSYKVKLVIKTQSGCENTYTGTVVIAPKPAATNCKAYFNFSIQDKVVKFNSSASVATSTQDSIISRIWLFGDSTTAAALQGNTVDPIHTYQKPGTYHVILYIKTKAGCESKYEATVSIAPPHCEVKVQFSAEAAGLKKIQYNSSLTTTAAGDSIVARNWKFGDNTSLGGNEISPVKEFSLFGFYNTCLQVKTANGCEAQVCKEVTIRDTITTPQNSVEYIKIITINPNPVITRMVATIYSRNTNAEAEISIYDIYGTPKLNIKKLLTQGNNNIEIMTDFLPHGPYFLKVSTKNGKDSKAFYKL